MDLNWINENKKTAGLVGFGVLALIALILSFLSVPQVTGTSYPQVYAYFTTPATLTNTVSGASLTTTKTVAVGVAKINSSNAASGGLAYYANVTSSLPSAASGWVGETEFTGAMYSGINDTGGTYATFTSNSSVKPVARVHFVLPDNGNTFTYTILSGVMRVNATKIEGDDKIGTGVSSFDLGAAARVNVTNATTLTTAAVFVIKGVDYLNSARSETLTLSVADAGSGKGVVSTGYFKNLTSISTSNTDFAEWQNFSMRTNYTNTNYTLDTLTQFGGQVTTTPYNYTASFDAPSNFSQPARIAFSTVKCVDSNATGINITVSGYTNASIATSETLRDIDCYAAANVSVTSHYFWKLNSINVTLNTTAKSLNFTTALNYVNISIAVYAAESASPVKFGYYNVTVEVANVSVDIYNWTGGAWIGINSSKVITLQNDTLNVSANGAYYVSGTSLYYRVSAEKNSTLTIDWANIVGVYFTNATGNRTLKMIANASASNTNCSVFGTSTAGTVQTDSFYFGAATVKYGAKEFGTVTSVACNASPATSISLNLTNYDASQTLVTLYGKNSAFTSFIARGVNNAFPVRTNMTSESFDLGQSDVDAGSKKAYLKCTGTVAGYVEYSTDNSSWSRESTTLGCNANATEYLLSSSALAARYYKFTVNHSYDAASTAGNVTALVQGRHAVR